MPGNRIISNTYLHVDTHILSSLKVQKSMTKIDTEVFLNQKRTNYVITANIINLRDIISPGPGHEPGSPALPTGALTNWATQTNNWAKSKMFLLLLFWINNLPLCVVNIKKTIGVLLHCGQMALVLTRWVVGSNRMKSSGLAQWFVWMAQLVRARVRLLVQARNSLLN